MEDVVATKEATVAMEAGKARTVDGGTVVATAVEAEATIGVASGE